jgi:pantoate kinase
MSNAVAFAPGHISGFFQPIYEPTNILRTGSRGAGFSVCLGATSSVSIQDADDQRIVTFLNGSIIESMLIDTCIRSLIGDRKLIVTCNIHLDLPISQGFGMSAASALSTAYALSDCLHFPFDKAVNAAHTAEVTLKTGLGDVIGSCKGGFEIRERPGLPPDGKIRTIYQDQDIVLCVVDTAVVTKDVLLDAKKLRSIDRYGGECTDSLVDDFSVKEFFRLSELFARETGLASDRVLDVIDIVKKIGPASMCMLGGSIFAMGDTKDLVERLDQFGQVFVTKVDMHGARILSTRS